MIVPTVAICTYKNSDFTGFILGFCRSQLKRGFQSILKHCKPLIKSKPFVAQMAIQPREDKGISQGHSASECGSRP